MSIKSLAAVCATVCFACLPGTSSASYVDVVTADAPVIWYRMQETGVGHTTPAANSGSSTTSVSEYQLTGGGSGSFADVNTPFIDPSVHPGKVFNRNVATNASAGASLVFDTNAIASSNATFEFLIRPDFYPTAANGGVLMGLYTTDGYAANQSIHINLNATSLEVATPSGGARRANLSSMVAPGDWAHVAITYETIGATNTVVMYVNGESINGTGATATSVNSLIDLGEAARIGTWAGGPRFFQGGLDEVAVYDRVLSEAEIAQHYNALTTPEPSTYALLGLGILGLAVVARKRHANRRK